MPVHLLPSWLSHSQPPKQPSSYMQRISDSCATFSKLTESSDGFQYMSRMLVCVAQTISPLLPLPAFSSTLNSVDQLIAGVRIILDGEYMMGLKLYNHLTNREGVAISCVGFIVLSDIGAALNLGNVLKLIDTTTAAASLGEISIYGIAPLNFLTQIALSNYILYTALAAYFCMGLAAFLRIYQDGDNSALTSTVLSRGVAEVAYKTVMIAGGTFLFTTVGIVSSGLLGTIAAGMALKTVYEFQNEPKKP